MLAITLEEYERYGCLNCGCNHAQSGGIYIHIGSTYKGIIDDFHKATVKELIGHFEN